MARVCDLSGKKTVWGNTRSFSMKRGNRSFKPNLFKRKIRLSNGMVVPVKICSKQYKKLRRECMI